MKIASVITETRPYDLKEIIERHIKFLPEMDVVCFHYNNSVNYDCIKHRLPHNITTLHQYNQLMTSEWFWDKLDYDKALIFQNDSGILREGIEDFLEYSYVGAPWKFQELGGNGGFSLRDVRESQWIVKNKPYHPIKGYEDVYFCNEMLSQGMNIAPRKVCEKFSCETIFKLGTFGYHAINNYLTKQQCDQIKNQYETCRT